jgi:hypothetical protein
MMDPHEPDEEARRRQTLMHMLDLIPAGSRHCRGCEQETECFIKSKSPSGDAKPRCLDCWKAER